MAKTTKLLVSPCRYKSCGLVVRMTFGCLTRVQATASANIHPRGRRRIPIRPTSDLMWRERGIWFSSHISFLFVIMWIIRLWQIMHSYWCKLKITYRITDALILLLNTEMAVHKQVMPRYWCGFKYAHKVKSGHLALEYTLLINGVALSPSL